jgi:hypothetical protein
MAVFPARYLDALVYCSYVQSRLVASVSRLRLEEGHLTREDGCVTLKLLDPALKHSNPLFEVGLPRNLALKHSNPLSEVGLSLELRYPLFDVAARPVDVSYDLDVADEFAGEPTAETLSL